MLVGDRLEMVWRHYPVLLCLLLLPVESYPPTFYLHLKAGLGLYDVLIFDTGAVVMVVCCGHPKFPGSSIFSKIKILSSNNAHTQRLSLNRIE